MNTYKVENFAGHDELVEVVHDLLDAAPVVPPVNVQKVNVRRAQLLERSLDSEVHRLGAVATIVDLCLDRWVELLELRRVLHNGVSG